VVAGISAEAAFSPLGEMLESGEKPLDLQVNSA
jgi:hypothetical protein